MMLLIIQVTYMHQEYGCVNKNEKKIVCLFIIIFLLNELHIAKW